MKFIKLISLMIMLTLGYAANAALIIDNFDTDQSFIQAQVGQTASSSVLGGGILGGERDLIVTNYGALNSSYVASIGVESGNLSFSADSTTTASFWMQWDGLDSSADINKNGLTDASTGLGVDLTTTASFLTEVLFSDADYLFDIELWWNNGNDSEKVTVLGPGHSDFMNPRNSMLNFDVFEHADLTNITAIQVGGNVAAPAEYLDFINGADLPVGHRVTAFDVTIGSVSAVEVPEPNTILLFAIALIGLGVFYRTKRKTK